MRYTPTRRAYYDDVVAFPEGDGLTATVQSDEVKSFETTAFGPVRVFLQGAGTDAVAHTKISFDEGETWHEVDETSFTDGFEDLGEVAEFAPRTRVDVDLNSQNIDDSDNWKVAVLNREYKPAINRSFEKDVLTVDETLGADEEKTETFELPEGTPQEIHAIVVSDSGEVTDASVELETSFDGDNWWSLSDSKDVSGDDVVFITNNDVEIGDRVRVKLTTDASSGEVTEDANLKVHLLSLVE